MNRTRVVVADDHAVLREGLRILINSQPDMLVVAEAGTGPDAVERIRETSARVLCLDLSMPGWGATTTIERVHAVSPRTRVLVLTMHDDPAYVRTAITAGASGYILKTTPTATLLSAIRGVAAGNRVIDAPLSAILDEAPPVAPGGQAVLSRREREVLELLTRGHTHQEIADRLFVSVKTVETYRARVREKTGLKTRADFVRYGLDAGMLMPPDGAAPPEVEG
ncbi:response regulator transcription factor [Fimbriiglobus ruber]|uniref:DNA-binding response regulator, LuxR family n=1 Tax=Fimbriiglobus ruber TaxID=1908690 RepID=A0A225E4X2_9BACT|nr:response regulator transcription factor [Fimbriiglobus ruber]OWK44539.1 DNA-binding response regulator, LuxR family [Fimbriiglobus ruber]